MFNTNAEGSYSYYDAQGRHLTTKHVYHLPDGTLKFTLDNTHSNPKDSSNLKNELLFYHLRNLVNTPKGETIYIVENEKDADIFEQFKMIAVCTYNGAGSGHFPRSVVPYFAGKNIVIFHANNDVSKQFAQEEASLVNPVATSVKVIDLSEIWEIMPEQATIGDYLQSYGDAGLQQAKHLIENTPVWTAPKARTEAKYLPIRSVKDLMQQHFAPTEFLVNGILPSGLALLASPPKFGKSWFALQLCLAVAKGTPFLGLSTTKSDVLYNGYIERKCKTNYDLTTAMDRELLLRFLDTTQPDTMAALRKIYNGQTEETIVKFILQSIDNKGSSLIETLKSGIEISNMHLDLLYGKPATDYNIDLVAKYNANIFSVMEEVWINDDQRIDLVVFLNGFAIATFELKCQSAGQNYRMAIKQYSEDRDPKNRLFLFKAGALVNFAMDLDTCYMTTKLDGLGTRFIPFNRGRGEGVNTGEGNPLDDGVDDYPMHYMWDDILRRDSLIELITKFVFIQREQVVDELTGKKSVKEKLIFPRYHQRDAVRQLLADAEYNGTQLNYLIEHSAGSGKTNTIAWLAHRLVSLHDTQNHIVYDSVLVITDRVVVDRQLQDAIKGIDHKSGLVCTIDDKKTSADLADALKGNYKIIVTTIQKFLYVDFWKLAQNQNNKTFAIIIDEAHSSTSGKDMIAVKNTLGQNDGPEEADAQDAIENEIQRHGKAPNVSVFAFTATPKPMTLRLFGRESIDADGHPVYQPFHLYSMKQAIEEGYILDVLQNYIEYKTYYKLNKTIEDDPEMKTIAAKRQIARYIDLFDDNINQRVNIIVEHFRSTVMQELGGQAKAMVITASREAAVKYRQAFEDYVTRHNYKDVKALVAFFGKVKIDDTEYTEPSMNGFAEDKLPKVFDGDEYNVLLVANKYQVGFDQPKLCAMYPVGPLRPSPP